MTTISNDQILAAAVGKAIAESVTPELTAAVFTEAFEAFMSKAINNYGNDKTTRAQATLQDALKATLMRRAEAFLGQPEQSAILDKIVAESFEELVTSGKLQGACREVVGRMFQNISLRT
jgi:hypothetical protein